MTKNNLTFCLKSHVFQSKARKSHLVIWNEMYEHAVCQGGERFGDRLPIVSSNTFSWFIFIFTPIEFYIYFFACFRCMFFISMIEYQFITIRSMSLNYIFTRKYLFRKEILGVLKHKSDWEWSWRGDERLKLVLGFICWLCSAK